MSLFVYTFEEADGTESTWSTQDPREAQDHGRKHGLAVIANEYEWADSEIAWDFRPEEETP